MSLIDQKTEPIVNILARVIASGYVKNRAIPPLSSMLVGTVGSGKTTQIKKVWSEGILFMSDVTPYGLTKLLPEIKAKNIKHLVIFDFVEPMSRSRSIVNNLIGFLNSLMEDSIFRISTGFITISEPLELGLITSTTPSELDDKRRGWLGIGFMSRMIPVTWDITEVDVIQILEDLAKSKMEKSNPIKINLKEKEIKENPDIFQKLIPYAQNIDVKQYPKPKPMRRLKQLQVLLMANALYEGRNEVTEKDFEWFKSVSRWINYDYNPL